MSDRIPLSEPQFRTAADVFDYCEELRKLALAIATSLDFAQGELAAVLADVGTPMASSRALLVSRHLGHAADAQREIAKSARRTITSFRRHFSAEIEAANRPKRRDFEFTGGA